MDFPRYTKAALRRIVFWLLLCKTLYVLSQDSTVFSLHVQKGSSNTPFNFALELFEMFYDCLCSTSNTSRCIVSSNLGTVVDVKTCPVTGNESQNSFSCQQSTIRSSGIVCERQVTPENPPITCTERPLEVQAGSCPQVQIHWNTLQTVTVSKNSSIVGTVCDDNCTTIVLNLLTSSSTTRSLVTGITKKAITPRTTSVFNNSLRPVTVSLQTSSADVTTLSTETVKDSGDNGKEGENESETIIIIGASISVIVIVAFIFIIVVIFWRRKKKSPSSTTTNTSNIEDQEDIYPYGDSTLNNTEPNENLNIDTLIVNGDVNSNPTRLSPISSSGYEKPKVHIDPRYISEGPRAKFNPESTTDGAGFGGYEKARPDVAYPYTTAHLSVENNPTPTAESVSSNGYEEISPNIACQYTSENPAANHKSTSSPEGVYAKLHDSARNITNVYNESPASENTCAVDC